ncbi:uncharacterized protein LOC136069278 [Quercus suber]|uniref:uncharacterized protein LOC136069278 n=1 Tax=Quercus suber TaxID=58331 RepID=UPI0032DF7ECE
MFRVLGSIEALNALYNLGLTHHDVNWVYNLNHLKDQGYYLKSRYPAVRLIQCLPTSNKGFKDDFLIFSGEWHDGLPCSTEEGQPDKRATRRNFRLINRESLDRILRSEVYVNSSDGQLRAAHLILKYDPASKAFQAPKYVIKAKDPRLHRISVAFEGFIVPEGTLIPEGVSFTEPSPKAIPSIGASSSRSVPQKVREGEEEKEKEAEEEEDEEDTSGGLVELPDSADEFEVFDQPQSPEVTSKKMVIQRRSQRSLKDVIEGQSGKVVEKQVQVNPPPLLSSPPKSPQPTVTEPSDPKRRREPKGKEVTDAGRTHTTSEGEDQRAAKQ